MSTNYLLISSSYRDRLLYPNPAEFIIPFGSNNTHDNKFDVFTTTNPITKNFPEFNSCWTNFFSNDPNRFFTKIKSINDKIVIVDENVNKILLGLDNPIPNDEIIVFGQLLENTYDNLKGFFLQVDINGTVYSRLIERYDPTTSSILLRNGFPSFEIPIDGYDCSIFNSYKLNPTQDHENDLYVTINGDFLKDSAIIYYSDDVFLYNVNTNEFRKTVQYEEQFYKYKIETPFSGNQPITDQLFLLGNMSSLYSGKVDLLANSEYFSYIPSSIFWHSKGMGYRNKIKIRLESNDPLLDDDYHIFTLENVSYVGEIIQEDLKIVSIGKQMLKQGVTYQIVPLDNNLLPRQYATLQIAAFSFVFQLSFENEKPLPSNLNGIYFFPIIMSQQYRVQNNTLIFQPNSSITVRNNSGEPIDLLKSQTENGVCGIKKAYTENGKYIIVTQQYSDMTKFILLGKAKRENKIPSFAKGIDNFLILNYNSDGVVPLNYTGSQITQSQMSCYELSVTSLILPNVILESTSGLLTSSYPYIFVEISNESLPSSGNTDIIYSNNPNAVKSTFICPTLDVNNPETTKFIKIGSGSGSQIMKFSPFDNLKVRISLPNGKTFKTETADNLVPNGPNPRIQITLLLEIQKC